jgi:glutathione S-transferase
MTLIWGRITSINVRKVIWALQELGMPFERKDAGAAFGVVHTDEYAQLNPNRLVPLLVQGERTLWESNVIVRYLCASQQRLCPTDPWLRADAERWMDWQQTTFSPAGRDAFIQLFRKPEGVPNMDKVNASVKLTLPLLDLLDHHLSQRPFLAGDAFGMADIPMGCEVHRWKGLPIAHSPRPHLDRWYAAVSQRPATRGVLDVPLS